MKRDEVTLNHSTQGTNARRVDCGHVAGAGPTRTIVHEAAHIALPRATAVQEVHERVDVRATALAANDAD